MNDIKLVLTDLDGCLTDGKIWLDDNGGKHRMYSVKDGKGFELISKSGIITGIMTSDYGEDIRLRSQQICINHLYIQCKDDKIDILNSLSNYLEISLKNIAYIGDDINDKEVLERVGYPFCPSDAVKSIKGVPNIHVLTKKGGEGIIREIAEIILGV